jgi:2-dehydro-3-deoxyphosphogluconate aldolase/(4S)-4-hydroxy-2-oxoglutarate aldolase
MNKSERLFGQLKEKRLIALLAPQTPDQCVTAHEALSPLGVVLEIAFRTAAAAEGIRAVLKRDPDALVLAGTVMTEAQTLEAVKAGAAGVISADYIPAVVACAIRHDRMCVPGGHGDAGKQLVQKAELYGCAFEDLKSMRPYQWIHKLFPAVTQDGVYAGLAQAWKGPYPGLRIVYTGGLTIDNVGALAKRDPEGIFCASALTASIDNPDRMAGLAGEWLSKIAHAPE